MVWRSSGKILHWTVLLLLNLFLWKADWVQVKSFLELPMIDQNVKIPVWSTSKREEDEVGSRCFCMSWDFATSVIFCQNWRKKKHIQVHVIPGLDEEDEEEYYEHGTWESSYRHPLTPVWTSEIRRRISKSEKTVSRHYHQIGEALWPLFSAWRPPLSQRARFLPQTHPTFCGVSIFLSKTGPFGFV